MTLSSTLTALPSFIAMGPVYERLVGFLPGWLAVTAVVALAAWAVLRRFRPVLAGPRAGAGDGLARWFHAPLVARRDWPWLAGGCIVLLLALDWQGFTGGFFRWDDFSFIQASRETPSLPALLNLYHADHSMPLFRLWVAGMLAWAGPNASAAELARLFNGVNFLLCLGVLLAGAMLLATCAVRRITAVCFCAFAWFWPGWGEFTTGFYTLSVYPQTLLCGLVAVILLRKHQQTGATGWMLAGILSALLASGLDISGVWVFPVLGGFAWAHGWKTPATRRLAPWLLLGFALAAGYHLVWFTHPFAGRELLQNPGGRALHQSLLANLTTYGWKLPLTIISGLGGTLLSEITPGPVGLVAPAFSGHALRSAPVYLAEFLALGTVLGIGWQNRHPLSPADRRLLVALALPVLIIIAMTSVARVHGLDLPATLWPTKYLCLPQVWAVLAGVFLLDRTALRSPESASHAARWIAGAVVAGTWLATTFWFTEKTLDIPTARRPAGRLGNVQAARQRRAEFAIFAQNLAELSRRIGRKQLDLPPPDGIFWAHPHLEFGYGATLGGSYRFTDLLSVDPGAGLLLRERPLAEIDPATLQAIATIPALQRVFEPTPPIP